MIDPYLPPGVTQAQIDRAHEGEEPPCEACDCAYDCEYSGFGVCVLIEVRPEPCPYRHFTAEESAAWARVFEGVT